MNNSNVMDFNSGRTFWKCIGKLVLSFVCVYLLLVYIDLGNLFKDLGPNNEVVLSTNHMDIKHNRRTDTKGI